VSLSRASDQVVTVDYTTANGSGAAGLDYVAAAGTLTFAPGETTKTVEVTVLDDAVNEMGETFYVRLSNAVNAAIVDGEGSGLIADNEPDPVYIWDIGWRTVTSGNKNNLQITVDIHSDANADGTAQTSDPGASGATVSLVLYHDSNNNGVYGDKRDKSWSGSATTDASGIATFNVLNAPKGNYRAEVTGVSFAGTTWGKTIDRERVSYYTGFPNGVEGPSGIISSTTSAGSLGVTLDSIANSLDGFAAGVGQSPGASVARNEVEPPAILVNGLFIVGDGDFLTRRSDTTKSSRDAADDRRDQVVAVEASLPPSALLPEQHELLQTGSNDSEASGDDAITWDYDEHDGLDQ
jgi:hypothetical protein